MDARVLQNWRMICKWSATLGRRRQLVTRPLVWSSVSDYIKSSSIFTFKWKLKKHFLHEKDT